MQWPWMASIQLSFKFQDLTSKCPLTLNDLRLQNPFNHCGAKGYTGCEFGQGRVMDYRGVSRRSPTQGAQWVINFGALKQSWRMLPSPPPPPEVEKKFNFWSQFAYFGAFILPKAPTQTQAPYLYKKWGGPIPPLNGALLVMLIYPSFPFLSPSFLSSFSFLSFFSSSFPFWYPFSDPGGPGAPKAPWIRPWITELCVWPWMALTLLWLSFKFQDLNSKWL